jgi:CheY-like chemotaxis protein
MAAADMIAESGFDSLEAKDADEAMLLLRTRDDIGFLFTDINMPGSMDGLELAHTVHDTWPPVKIVMTSGRMNLKPCDIPTGAQFVAKPYSQNSVTRVLCKLAA